MNLKDRVEKLSELQTGLWSTVGQTVGEALAVPISFANPFTTLARPADLSTDVTTTQLVIEFALAGAPESIQILLMRSDSILGLAKLATGAENEEVSENVLTDIRAACEALVQGLCLGIGRLTGETAVATSLAIRYQALQIPPNFAAAVEIARVGVNLEAEEFSGSLTWAFDAETAALMLGEPARESAIEDSTYTVPPQIMALSNAPGEPRKLDILLDVPLEISVELGRVKMTVREIVDLGTGSIVEVDRSAGEPVDVMVNGRRVARGEVVVIEDNFGVRITEILDPNQRVGKLDQAA